MTDRLLISTSKRLVLWDGEAHTVMPMSNPEWVFYGITWSPTEIYVVGGTNIYVLDEGLNQTGKLELDLWGAHQCYWWDGMLYILQAARNEITTWDGERKSTLPYPYFEPGEDPHINSMWCDGEHFYVVEHWQSELPKRIRKFDMEWTPENTYLVGSEHFGDDGHSGIHNVYRDGRIIYTLGPGTIIRISTVPESFSWPIPQAHSAYLRGLARSLSTFYVGVSVIAERERRHLDGDSAILCFDDSMNQTGQIVLEDTGQLCDIRCIDPLDLAHNGVPCPARRVIWK